MLRKLAARSKRQEVLRWRLNNGGLEDAGREYYGKQFDNRIGNIRKPGDRAGASGSSRKGGAGRAIGGGIIAGLLVLGYIILGCAGSRARATTAATRPPSTRRTARRHAATRPPTCRQHLDRHVPPTRTRISTDSRARARGQRPATLNRPPGTSRRPGQISGPDQSERQAAERHSGPGRTLPRTSVRRSLTGIGEHRRSSRRGGQDRTTAGTGRMTVRTVTLYPSHRRWKGLRVFFAAHFPIGMNGQARCNRPALPLGSI